MYNVKDPKVALVLIDRLVGGSERRYLSIVDDLAKQCKQDAKYSFEIVINNQLLEYIRGYPEFQGALDRVSVKVIRSCFSSPGLGNKQGKWGRFLPRKIKFSIKFLAFLVNYAMINFQLFLLVFRQEYSLLHFVGYQGVLSSIIPLPSSRVYSFVGYDVRCLEGIVRPKFYFPRLIALAIRRACFAEVNTEELYDTLLRVSSIENDKVRLNRSFVETGLFEVKDKLDIVVFAARFEEYKQPLLMLSSIPKVLAAFPDRDLNFHIAGEGHMEEAMKKKISDLGISERVYLGHCSDMPDLLGQSKVFLSLQKDENYGSRSLFEAMSCGNAIVATDVGYTSHLVTPDTGILVSSDADEIAKAMIQVLADEPMRHRMGEQARKVVEQGYRKSDFVDNTVGMYFDVVNTGNSSLVNQDEMNNE